MQKCFSLNVPIILYFGICKWGVKLLYIMLKGFTSTSLRYWWLHFNTWQELLDIILRKNWEKQFKVKTWQPAVRKHRRFFKCIFNVFSTWVFTIRSKVICRIIQDKVVCVNLENVYLLETSLYSCITTVCTSKQEFPVHMPQYSSTIFVAYNIQSRLFCVLDVWCNY